MDGTQAVGWLGLAFAVVAMIRGELAARTAARAQHDKAEGDRLAAKDKLEYDSKFQLMQAENADLKLENGRLEAQLTEIKAELRRCADSHMESERDRAELRGRLAVLEMFIAKPTGVQP